MGHKASGAQVLLESSAAKQHAKSLIWLGLISKLKPNQRFGSVQTNYIKLAYPPLTLHTRVRCKTFKSTQQTMK